MVTKLEDYLNAPIAKGQVKYEPGWYLLILDLAFLEQFKSRAEELSLEVEWTAKPHISITKAEAPNKKEQKFSRAFVNERVEFQYHDQLHYENGRHVWLNCYSPRLCQIREYFGLPTLSFGKEYRVNFHLTLGKLMTPRPATMKPHFKLSLATGINAESLMQHV